MVKEINFPCMSCSHFDVCIYTANMRLLDEQLKQCAADAPHAKINITCDKFASKEVYSQK